MKLGPKYINQKLYKKILEVLPVACADSVVVHGKKFLLGKRKNKPAKGGWFLIGGRIIKGEKLEDAARRHVSEETGIKRVKIKKFLGARETIYPDSAQGPSSHTVNFVYLAEINPAKTFSVSKESSEFKWFSKINKTWHPYAREMLRKAGFR